MTTSPTDAVDAAENGPALRLLQWASGLRGRRATSTERVHRWWAVLLAAAAVAVNVHRENQGLEGRLAGSLSPAELIALRHNPILDTAGFPSGSELTGVSLPLRGYGMLDRLGLDVIDTTLVMVAIETAWLFIAITWAVRIVRPASSLGPAAVAGVVATVGYGLAGNNLANWGFVWGWNYGFAYGVTSVAMAFGLRRRWTEASVAIAVLLTIHSLVAFLTALALVPLLAADALQRRLRINWMVTTGALAAGGLYLVLFSGDARLSSSELDIDAYLARLRAFQSHLFVEFDTDFLRIWSQHIAAWSVAVLAVLVASLLLRRQGDDALACRLLVITATLVVVSMLGWWHSTLDRPNVTVLLLALHRSSIFVNLLVLTIVLPVLVERARRLRSIGTMLAVVVWLAVPGLIDHLIAGIVVTAALVWTLVALTRDAAPDTKPSQHFVILPAALAVVIAGWFFWLAIDLFAGGPRALAQTVQDDLGLLCLFAAVLIVALASRLGLTSRLGDRRWRDAVLGSLAVGTVLLVTGTALFQDRRPVRLADQELVEVQLWAKRNTSRDAVFLLPLADYGFGWRVFSERASAGTPREWLHYAILYSRDQARLEEGTRRVALFGVDADQWFSDHPELGAGSSLVRELAARFAEMSDREVLGVVAELDVDYVVFERPHERSPSCFAPMFENDTFSVAQPTPSTC